MADYYQHCSFTVPLTQAQAEWAIGLLDTCRDIVDEQIEDADIPAGIAELVARLTKDGNSPGVEAEFEEASQSEPPLRRPSTRSRARNLRRLRPHLGPWR